MPEQSPTPVVPDELAPLLDDSLVQTAIEEWRGATIKSVNSDMRELELTATEFGRAVVLEPKDGNHNETTIVLGLPYQQAWKRSMYIRAGLAHHAINPHARMVILPNNTVGEINIDLPSEELEKVTEGNLRPFYEQQVRVLEDLGVQGDVILSGYSLGALSAIGLAAVCSDKFRVGLINADEPPTGGRSSKELRGDFMKSSGWGAQRAAIADANIPVLSRVLNTRRLGTDFLRFGVASFDPFSQALLSGMAQQDFGELLQAARQNWPEAPIKIGEVAGSRLVRVNQIPADISELRSYTGDGTHMHATGDNVVAHALMMLDAVTLAEK